MLTNNTYAPPSRSHAAFLAPGKPSAEIIVHINSVEVNNGKNYRFPVATGRAYFLTIARIAGKFSSEQ